MAPHRTSPSGRPLPIPAAAAGHWGLDPGVVFLNHGSFGACPREVLSEQRRLQDLLEHEPIRFFVELCEGMLDQSRHALARLLGADAEGIAFVANATTGVNSVLRSLRWAPGDELLTNDHEYNACNNALRFVADQWSCSVVTASAPFPVRSEDEIVDAVLRRVTPRTRLALLSHVTSPTGLVFPIKRLVHELARRGVDTLVDGAHAPGMTPIDLADLGAAYYTGNLHKWLCAPKGCAFLHVREDRREPIRPLVISHGANSPRTDRSRFRVEFDYIGTSDVTPYLCIPACIGFLSQLGAGGSDLRAHMECNRALTLQGRRVLCESLDIDPQTLAPESMLGALAAVPIPMPASGVIPPSVRGYHDGLQDRLIVGHAIQAPVFPFPPGPTGHQGALRIVRIAMQAYNSIEQVRYLAECLGDELEREGARVPARR